MKRYIVPDIVECHADSVEGSPLHFTDCCLWRLLVFGDIESFSQLGPTAMTFVILAACIAAARLGTSKVLTEI